MLFKYEYISIVIILVFLIIIFICFGIYVGWFIRLDKDSSD